MLASGEARTDEGFKGIRQDRSELISAEFYDCRFVECSFVESTFRACRFIGCNFEQCDLSLVELTGCQLRSCRFERSKLVGVNWTRVQWSAGGFEAALEFEECLLNHSTFIGLKLPGLKLSNCVAREVDFRECSLQQADFAGTDLSDSLFNRTDLSQADLSRARNYAIDPGRNQITGARFTLPEALALLYSMDIDLTEE